LFKELAGGVISSDIHDVYPEPIKKVNIDISWNNINRLIGKAIGKDVIKGILNSLDFVIIKELDEGFNLDVPFYRVDVTREADIIEEILRVYGYNNIEIPQQVRSAVSHAKKPDPEKVKNTVADFLTANGFKEIMNNSLTKSAYYEGNLEFPVERCVRMLNPLSLDLNVMRQSLIYGGLETILYNQNRKNQDLRLFELGKVYSIPDKDKNHDSNYEEHFNLSLFVTGRKEIESWNTGDEEIGFYELKAICQNLLKRVGVELNKLKFENIEKAYFSQGIRFKNKKNTLLEIGKFSKDILKTFDIKQDVYYAEMDWDLLITLNKRAKISFVEIPKFPEVRRDLALLIDSETTFAEIEKIAIESERQYLKSVNLFDVYEGKNIESGKKSYAVSFALSDPEKTLTDKVIDKIMSKLMKAYEAKLGATIR